MKRWTSGLTIAIACTSLYVFAVYKPKLSALQKKIISEITAAADLLSEGTRLVLTGEPAQKSIAAKREEHERAARKALERQKSLSGRSKTGGFGSSYPSSYGRNRYGGSSYTPYGGSHGSYGGSYGGNYGGSYRPSYGGGGYDPYSHSGISYDDDDGEHSTSSSNQGTSPTSSSNDSANSGGVDPQAKQAAEQAAQERSEADQSLIDAAETIASTIGGMTPSNPDYAAKITALKDDGAFQELASGARTHRKNTKKANAPAAAPTPVGRKPGMPAPRKAAAAKPAEPKASPLDGKIAALYNRILPHVIFAATAANDTSAADALKSDIKHVVGQGALDNAAQGAIKIQFDEWKAGTGKDYALEKTIFEANKAFITGAAGAPAAFTIPRTVAAAAVCPVSRGLAAPAAGAVALDKDAVKAAYKPYFQRCFEDLEARGNKFTHLGISASALGELKKQKDDCKKILADAS